MSSYNHYNDDFAKAYEDIARTRNPRTSKFAVNLFEAYASTSKRAKIFLSHKSCDKESVKIIAEYLEYREIDYYLDAEDPNLQKAFKDGDNELITHFIEIGINTSSHIMPCLSHSTRESWWVPYEIGFARSQGKGITTLFLKDVEIIPEYLKITEHISEWKELKRFLNRISQRNEKLANAVAMRSSFDFENARQNLALAKILK